MNRASLWGAHLFVPANNAGFINDLPMINTTNIILDLEYATNIDEKFEARYLAKWAIKYIRELRPEININIRINIPSLPSICDLDLATVLSAEPNAIRLPSVNSAEEVRFICSRISYYEKLYALPPDVTKLHIMIESPKGMANIREIASASTRIEALCLGGEDWAANIGVERTKDGLELDIIRNLIVSTAAEFMLTPIDTVYSWIDDHNDFEKDCLRSKTIGMKARAIQNPKQIDICHSIYSPSKKQIQMAEKLLEKLGRIEMNGDQILISDKKIIDRLALYQAQMILKNKSME